MEAVIRQLKEEEFGVLGDFLYEAIFIPEGVEPPPRDIIEKPELKLYIEDFGSSPQDNSGLRSCGRPNSVSCHFAVQ